MKRQISQMLPICSLMPWPVCAGLPGVAPRTKAEEQSNEARGVEAWLEALQDLLFPSARRQLRISQSTLTTALSHIRGSAGTRPVSQPGRHKSIYINTCLYLTVSTAAYLNKRTEISTQMN